LRTCFILPLKEVNLLPCLLARWCWLPGFLWSCLTSFEDILGWQISSHLVLMFHLSLVCSQLFTLYLVCSQLFTLYLVCLQLFTLYLVCLQLFTLYLLFTIVQLFVCSPCQWNLFGEAILDSTWVLSSWYRFGFELLYRVSLILCRR